MKGFEEKEQGSEAVEVCLVLGRGAMKVRDVPYTILKNERRYGLRVYIKISPCLRM